MPWILQASRIVVPAGTVTAWPSMVRLIDGGASTGGAGGGCDARAGGVRRISVSGWAPGPGGCVASPDPAPGRVRSTGPRARGRRPGRAPRARARARGARPPGRARARGRVAWDPGRRSQRHQPGLPEGRLDGRRGRLAEAADRGVAHGLADLAQEDELLVARPHPRAGGQARQQLLLADAADPARDALAARLVAEELRRCAAGCRRGRRSRRRP